MRFLKFIGDRHTVTVMSAVQLLEIHGDSTRQKARQTFNIPRTSGRELFHGDFSSSKTVNSRVFDHTHTYRMQMLNPTTQSKCISYEEVSYLVYTCLFSICKHILFTQT